MTQLYTGRPTVTAADLQKHLGQIVLVNYKTVDTEPKVFEGKIRLVTPTGVVLRNRSTDMLIELDEIIDFDVIGHRKRRIVRRHLRPLGEDKSVRQHLADRHAVMIDVLNSVDETTARIMHDRIDHGKLGHMHRTESDEEALIDELGDEE
jgi:hypothetical protein